MIFCLTATHIIVGYARVSCRVLRATTDFPRALHRYVRNATNGMVG